MYTQQRIIFIIIGGLKDAWRLSQALLYFLKCIIAKVIELGTHCLYIASCFDEQTSVDMSSLSASNLPIIRFQDVISNYCRDCQYLFHRLNNALRHCSICMRFYAQMGWQSFVVPSPPFSGGCLIWFVFGSPNGASISISCQLGPLQPVIGHQEYNRYGVEK